MCDISKELICDMVFMKTDRVFIECVQTDGELKNEIAKNLFT